MKILHDVVRACLLLLCGGCTLIQEPDIIEADDTDGNTIAFPPRNQQEARVFSSAQLQLPTASAMFWLSWNEQELEVLARVDDDDVRAVVEAGGSGKVWRDDAIEVFIDPTHDGGEQMSGEDLQVVLNANGALFSNRTVVLSASEVTRTEQGWEARLSLPWSELGIASPRSDLRLGLNLALDDLDLAASGEASLEQIDLGEKRERFQQPSLWQSVTLSP